MTLMERESVLTDLLHRAQDGEQAAAEAFFAESYPMLARLARARLRAHVRTPTLDTGALVNEACLRFVAAGRLRIEDSTHFRRWAARVMRSVIVDMARRRQAERRGGGMARVFLGSERALDRRIVVKVLDLESAVSASAERFRREIKLVAQLQHPHIVPVFTAGGDDGLTQLDQRLRLRAHLEADSEGLGLERAGDWKHDIGQLGGRVHEQIGVDVEVQSRQGFAPTPAIGVREQQVGAESHQSAHPVGA